MRVAGAGGGDLHVVDKGHGAAALVFLHFFGGSSDSWRPVIDRLEGVHRCIAPDLRGFGRSPDIPATWAVDAAADDLRALIRQRLEGGDFLLAGHSMGAKIALALAAKRPAGLKGLVLVGPSPPTPEPMGDEGRAELLRSHGSRPAAEAIIRRITRRRLAPEVLERCVEDELATSAAAWRWWLEEGSREDISRRVGSVEPPGLVVVGGDDPVIPGRLAVEHVLPAFTAAKLVTIPETGHLLPLEAPDELSERISAFAASVPSRDRPMPS